MVQTRIITPKVAEGFVSRQTSLGVDTYDLNELYSPDTEVWKSKVLDLGSPKYPPQVAAAPTRYWFDRSRYNNHGTITGATWEQLSSGARVMKFDGDDYIQSTSKSFSPTDTNWGVSLWLYYTTDSGRLFAQGNTGDDAPFLSIDIGFTSATKVSTTGRADNNSTTHSVTNNTVLLVNNWYKVTVTKVDTTISVFINNGAATTGLFTSSATTTNTQTFGALKRIALGSYLTGREGLVACYTTPPGAAVIASDFAQERHLFGA